MDEEVELGGHTAQTGLDQPGVRQGEKREQQSTVSNTARLVYGPPDTISSVSGVFVAALLDAYCCWPSCVYIATWWILSLHQKKKRKGLFFYFPFD